MPRLMIHLNSVRKLLCIVVVALLHPTCLPTAGIRRGEGEGSWDCRRREELSHHPKMFRENQFHRTKDRRSQTVANGASIYVTSTVGPSKKLVDVLQTTPCSRCAWLKKKSGCRCVCRRCLSAHCASRAVEDAVYWNADRRTTRYTACARARTRTHEVRRRRLDFASPGGRAERPTMTTEWHPRARRHRRCRRESAARPLPLRRRPSTGVVVDTNDSGGSPVAAAAGSMHGSARDDAGGAARGAMTAGREGDPGWEGAGGCPGRR